MCLADRSGLAPQDLSKLITLISTQLVVTWTADRCRVCGSLNATVLSL